MQNGSAWLPHASCSWADCRDRHSKEPSGRHLQWNLKGRPKHIKRDRLCNKQNSYTSGYRFMFEKNGLLEQKICTKPPGLPRLKKCSIGNTVCKLKRYKINNINTTAENRNARFFHILPCPLVSLLLRLSMHSASILENGWSPVISFPLPFPHTILSSPTRLDNIPELPCDLLLP